MLLLAMIVARLSFSVALHQQLIFVSSRQLRALSSSSPPLPSDNHTPWAALGLATQITRQHIPLFVTLLHFVFVCAPTIPNTSPSPSCLSVSSGAAVCRTSSPPLPIQSLAIPHVQPHPSWVHCSYGIAPSAYSDHSPAAAARGKCCHQGDVTPTPSVVMRFSCHFGDMATNIRFCWRIAYCSAVTLEFNPNRTHRLRPEAGKRWREKLQRQPPRASCVTFTQVRAAAAVPFAGDGGGRASARLGATAEQVG